MGTHIHNAKIDTVFYAKGETVIVECKDKDMVVMTHPAYVFMKNKAENAKSFKERLDNCINLNEHLSKACSSLIDSGQVTLLEKQELETYRKAIGKSKEAAKALHDAVKMFSGNYVADFDC